MPGAIPFMSIFGNPLEFFPSEEPVGVAEANFGGAVVATEFFFSVGLSNTKVLLLDNSSNLAPYFVFKVLSVAYFPFGVL